MLWRYTTASPSDCCRQVTVADTVAMVKGHHRVQQSFASPLALPLLQRGAFRKDRVFMTTRWRFVSLAAGVMALALTAGPLTAQTPKTARLSTKEVVTLIQNAKTSADHERLAAYYDQTAVDLDEKAKEHKELAAAYKRMPDSGNPRIPSPARPVSHCESIATDASKAATEARSMAEHHRMLAKEAGKTGQ